MHEVAPIVQSQQNQSQLLQQGKTLYETGQFADAAKVWQQAAQVYQSQADRLNLAQAQIFLSLAYQQLGQWSEANKAIAASLQLLKNERLQTKDSKLILARALNTQGNLQLALGQAELALATWQQAATIYAQAGYNAGITGSLINQAQALQNLGFYRRANKTLTQLEQSLQIQPDSLLKATGLRSLGNALFVVGDLEQSRRVLQQSLLLAQKLKSGQEIAATKVSLGNTAKAQQDNAAALKFYQQASLASTSLATRVQAQLNQLSLLVETESWLPAQALWLKIPTEINNLPPSRTAVYAQINLAQSLIRLKQLSTASTPSWTEIGQLLAKAIQQAKSIKDDRAQAYALGHLGGLYEQTGQFRSATDLTQQALNLADAINASDIAYRWQWQLGRLFTNQGNIQLAIAAYDRAVDTLQLLRRDLVAINPEVQFDFRDQVEPVYRQLVDLLLQSSVSSQPSQENLQKARNTIESLQLAELENFFRSACLDAKPEQIDRVVDSDDPTAAVIYPIILSDRLEIILKLPTQEKLRHYVTDKSQSEVESTLDKLRQYLVEPDRTNDVKKLSQQVYGWLIQPLEVELRKIKVRTLVFVLDGPLRNIPMASLYDNEQKQYLVEKYAVALAPGLQMLAPKPLQTERLNVLIAGVGDKRSVEGREFAQLENVRRELQAIESEVPKSKELFNQAFTKKNIQNQINSGTFSVVHLATHGKFSSKLDQTFILTWNQLLKINDLDNLLRTSKPSLSRDIELLVLSACQTAAGDKRAALGLAGVAVRAGARSTLATLWQVNDRSTTELMIQFYRELLINKVTKAKALQRAQIALLTNYRYENYESPYYWAPYVMLGNWF